VPREEWRPRYYHAGLLLTRAIIEHALWERARESGSNVIEVHVRRLRTKLSPRGESSLMQTERSAGYRFGPVPPGARSEDPTRSTDACLYLSADRCVARVRHAFALHHRPHAAPTLGYESCVDREPCYNESRILTRSHRSRRFRSRTIRSARRRTIRCHLRSNRTRCHQFDRGDSTRDRARCKRSIDGRLRPLRSFLRKNRSSNESSCRCCKT